MLRLSRRGTVLAAIAWALPSLSLAQDADVARIMNISDEAIYKEIADPTAYHPELHPCPRACGHATPDKWTLYSSFDRLAVCAEPMLLDFALYNPILDSDTPTKMSACTEGGNADSRENALLPVQTQEGNKTPARVRRRQDAPATECGLTNAQELTVSMDLVSEGTDEGKDVSAIIDRVQDYFHDKASCGSPFIFGYNQGMIVGLYIGPSMGRNSIGAIAEHVKASPGSTTVAQLCGNGRNAHHVFGMIASQNASAVQEAVKSWSRAECVGGYGVPKQTEVKIWESVIIPFNATNSTANFTRRAAANYEKAALHRRADCRTEKVIGGDGCASLASRCGISGAKFTEYNPDKNFCSSLVPGQRVCCSSGTLPDIRPKPHSNGTCASYFVKGGDFCSSIAAENGLTVKDLEKFNNGSTWGWSGCGSLLKDSYMCLSTGKPPLPFPQPGAVCGPTAENTTMPTDGTKLEDLNPCPLNACCNIWGHCGVTSDFCTYKPGPSPGTSKIKDGCVSSCGQEITNNDKGPSQFGRIGYYESFNWNRKCLHLAAHHANTDQSYSHIHWAFANINAQDWTVKINDTHKQWALFKSLPVKKIISFGGWGYSTEPDTYDILRQGMSQQNRSVFAANIAKFVDKEGLDGVDFDWEYPGATDIDFTPPGKKEDTSNYLKFLTVMKGALSKGKSISIAAPASYWYLKAFPIASMSKILDYIVYMTYDLHGQWDAGSQWASGCPTGNCLRSHVNITETVWALSMITKAGVPSNKIFVGESSYGRSFKMSKAGCKGPTCTFTGDRLNSNAKKGLCTDTAGYLSNAEIDQIITSGNSKIDSYVDTDSLSNILVYDQTEWVAYMNDANKALRRLNWFGKNFAGTIDWAVDLQNFADEDMDPLKSNGGDDDDDEEWPDLAPCEGSYASLEDLESAGESVPSHCRSRYIIHILKDIHKQSMKDYDALIAGGYDKKFKTYADAVVHSGQKSVDELMHDHGNDYFTCTVTEDIQSCDHCTYLDRPDTGKCRYCEDYDDGWSSVCEQPEVLCGDYELRWKNITGPCPPDFSLRAGEEPSGGYGNSVYWKLRGGDAEDKFWAAMYSNNGMKEEDVTWATVSSIPECHYDKETCKNMFHDYNYPKVTDFTRDDVIDPGDVVSKSSKALEQLGPDLDTLSEMVDAELYAGQEDEIVDAISIPIFMVQSAVKAMTSIDDTVDKWNAAKRKNIILAFLSAILFFIPIVGELAGAVLGLAAIGRTIAVLGALGEVAMDIYTMVDDPDNIALGLFGLILAPLGIMDAVQIGKAAARRADMKPEELKALGDGVKLPVEKIDVIRGASCAVPTSLQTRMFGVRSSSLYGEQTWVY